MKKTIMIFMAILMMGSSIIPTSAHENDTSNEDESDVMHIVSESEVETTDGTYKELVISDNDETFISEIHGDEIFLYDEDQNLIATATFSTKEVVNASLFEDRSIEISPYAAVDTYDKWRNWIPTKMVQFVPKFSGTSIQTGVLTSLMVSAFTGAALFVPTTAISLLCGAIVDSVYNGQYIYVKGDYSYNTYCEILRKERVNQYNANGSLKRYGPATTRWLNTPWDYATAPAACRILTQKY